MFVVAFLASIVAGNMLTVGPSLYLPGASVEQLRVFYGTSGAAVIVQSGLQALAAIALYWFGIRMRAALRGAGGRRAVTAMGWGTGIAAGSLLASVGCALVLMLVAASASDGAVAGLGRSTLVLGGAAHLLGSGLLITVTSTVALRSGARTRWVFGYGRFAGPVVALSAVSVLFPPLIRPEPPFRLLAAVWIVGAAVAALRGRLTAGPTGRPSRRTVLQPPSSRTNPIAW